MKKITHDLYIRNVISQVTNSAMEKGAGKSRIVICVVW